jgi:hypothetical protein
VAGELNITRGLQRGLSITLSLPFLEIGRPHWDAISHDVHGALDWGQGSREIFARSGTLLYAWSPRQQRALEAWDELEGSGVGDLTVSLAGPLGGWAGAAHRWAVVLQAPTGRRGTLQGSGGWDGGVRWMATWNRTAAIWRLAAGYSHLDPGGDLLGVERADTWHLSGEMHRRWGARGSWLVATRWETSPLADFTGGEVGSSTFFFTFGARRQLGDGSWVAVALGENLVPRGIAPDFTLSVQIGSTLPSSSP